MVCVVTTGKKLKVAHQKQNNEVHLPTGSFDMENNLFCLFFTFIIAFLQVKVFKLSTL